MANSVWAMLMPALLLGGNRRGRSHDTARVVSLVLTETGCQLASYSDAPPSIATSAPVM
jgi:hypothetical protein